MNHLARTASFVVAMTTWVCVGTPLIARADEVTDPPIAVAIAVPEDPTDPPEGGSTRCSISVGDPVDDGTNITGHGLLQCDVPGVTPTLKLELHRYSSATGPAIGAGGHVEYCCNRIQPGVTSIGHSELGPGFYRTIGQSVVIYPYTLNRSVSPGAGCHYFDGRTIVCNVASSPIAAGINP